MGWESVDAETFAVPELGRRWDTAAGNPDCWVPLRAANHTATVGQHLRMTAATDRTAGIATDSDWDQWLMPVGTAGTVTAPVVMNEMTMIATTEQTVEPRIRIEDSRHPDVHYSDPGLRVARNRADSATGASTMRTDRGNRDSGPVTGLRDWGTETAAAVTSAGPEPSGQQDREPGVRNQEERKSADSRRNSGVH